MTNFRQSLCGKNYKITSAGVQAFAITSLPCPIPALKELVPQPRVISGSKNHIETCQYISPTVYKFSSCAVSQRIINMYYTHILYRTIQTFWPHISGFSKRVRISHSCFRNVHPKPIKYGLCTQDWITCCHILPSYAP